MSKTKKNALSYRTLVTIYPETPTRPHFTLQEGEPGETWATIISTTDQDFYDTLVKKSGYKVDRTLNETEIADALP